MTEPKTAQQHPSPDDKAFIEEAWQAYKSGKVPSRDHMKLKVALRLLVEKWRENANFYDYTQEHESTNHTVPTLRQCAKELEEALK